MLETRGNLVSRIVMVYEDRGSIWGHAHKLMHVWMSHRHITKLVRIHLLIGHIMWHWGAYTSHAPTSEHLARMIMMTWMPRSSHIIIVRHGVLNAFSLISIISLFSLNLLMAVLYLAFVEFCMVASYRQIRALISTRSSAFGAVHFKTLKQLFHFFIVLALAQYFVLTHIGSVVDTRCGVEVFYKTLSWCKVGYGWTGKLRHFVI